MNFKVGNGFTHDIVEEVKMELKLETFQFR